MEKKRLNRYRLAIKAAMSWKQVDRYWDNDISRLDTFVLCKLCTNLKCSIQNLLVFVPVDSVQKELPGSGSLPFINICFCS